MGAYILAVLFVYEHGSKERDVRLLVLHGITCSVERQFPKICGVYLVVDGVIESSF